MHDFPARLASVIGEESGNSFARRAGFSESVLRKYLDGTQKPGMENLVRIAELANVSLDWLIAGRGRRAAPRRATAATDQPSVAGNPRWEKIVRLIDCAQFCEAEIDTLLHDIFFRILQAAELAKLRREIDTIRNQQAIESDHCRRMIDALQKMTP